MKLLLVGGYESDASEVDSLLELGRHISAILPPDTTVDRVFLSDIAYTISPTSFNATITPTVVSVADYDTVYIRGPKMRMRSEQAFYLSRFCDAKNIRCINDYSLYYPGTKVAQSIIFYEQSAPFLKTIYTYTNATLLLLAEQEFGYPYILKTTTGSHGDANHLIKSREQAERAIEEENQIDFLAQQFCENDRDYRILITPDDSLIFARLGSADTHLNNTSKGAGALLATKNEVPEQYIMKSREIASRLKLELAGVDIMPKLGTKEFYFLEINSQPQFRTGVFLEEKADFIRKLIIGESKI